MKKLSVLLFSILVPLAAISSVVQADETCMSPYIPKITGQEDFVYVWTLGVEGIGDEQDKLVTIDARPASDSYGKVIHSLSVGGRNEAHHSGLSDDRRFLWAGGLDTNKIVVFDIHSDPAAPKIHQVIDDFTDATGGLVGPHTFYALPGRMLITALSNNADQGGRTGFAEYNNQGEYITTHWIPTDADLRGAVKSGQLADGYGYDLRVKADLNIMLTSSFTGWSNYMMDFGQMLQDAAAMQRFGNTMVVWDMHTRQPKKVLDVPGTPLEIRCAWAPENRYCFTSTALTSQIWLIYEDDQGEWQAKAVADIGDPSTVPLPVDISITSDDKGLWVDTFLEGKARYYDISDPFAPKQVYEKVIGSQINMVSQSWDGKRVYFSSSLLARWDKLGEADEQYVKLYHWDGNELTHEWSIDFYEQGLGRAHQMRFGAYSTYGMTPPLKSINQLSLLNNSQ